MRRRTWWAGLPWVEYIEGDAGDGRVCQPPLVRRTVEEALDSLTARHWRYVEIGGTPGAYKVRVMPRPMPPLGDGLWAGISYNGHDLASILATAAEEVSLLWLNGAQRRMSAVERVRYVP